MRTKEIRYYLHNLDALREDISNLTQSLETFKALDFDTKITPTFSHLPKSQDGNNSKVEQCIIKRDEQIYKVQREILKKKTICDAIIGVLRYIDRDSVTWRVLELRYFDKKQGIRLTFRDIAQRLNYSVKTIEHIDGKIVSNIQKRLGFH